MSTVARHPVPQLCLLSQAAPGVRWRVVGCSGGGPLERRLHEIGLPRGSEVRVVQRLGRRGATVVDSHGARLAVGAEVAAQIEVVAVLAG